MPREVKFLANAREFRGNGNLSPGARARGFSFRGSGLDASLPSIRSFMLTGDG